MKSEHSTANLKGQGMDPKVVEPNDMMRKMNLPNESTEYLSKREELRLAELRGRPLSRMNGAREKKGRHYA